MLPWDLVAGGLKPYLRLGYVATTLAGAALAAEVAVLAVEGTAEERRATIADWLASLPDKNVDALLVLLLAVAGVFAAYLIGAAGRLVASAVFAAINLFWSYGRIRIRILRHKSWEDSAQPEPPERPPAWRRRLAPLRPLYWGARAFVAPIFPVRFESKHLWAHLDSQFGEEAVKGVLRRHPIRIQHGDPEEKLMTASGYCQLWLRRYTPDAAVPTEARRTLILLAAAAPALLLPATLQAVAADVGPGYHWLGWVWPVLFLAGVVAVANSLREANVVGLLTFHQFMLIQFVETGAPPRSGHVRDE
jgi:hypothetical protein